MALSAAPEQPLRLRACRVHAHERSSLASGSKTLALEEQKHVACRRVLYVRKNVVVLHFYFLRLQCCSVKSSADNFSAVCSLLHLSSLIFAAMRDGMRRGCVGIALTALLLVVAQTNGLVPEGGSKNMVSIAADEYATRRRPVRVGRRATSCEVHRRVDAERSCAAVAAVRHATR